MSLTEKINTLFNGPRTDLIMIMVCTFNIIMLNPIIKGWGWIDTGLWIFSILALPIVAKRYKTKTGKSAWRELYDMRPRISVDSFVTFIVITLMVGAIAVGAVTYLQKM